MGRTLRRYLAREILGSFLAGLAVFTFILLVARILDLIDLVLARGVPVVQVLRLFGYVLPSFLEISIPMAVLLGVVVTFSRLSSDGELLAIRAAGISLFELARPVVALGLAAAVLTLAVAAYARPWAQRHITETVYEIAKTRATAALRPRIFNTLTDNLVIYVDSIDTADGALEGILLSDEREGYDRTTTFSEVGRLLANERDHGMYLRLLDGTSLTYHAGDQSYDVTEFASLEVTLDIDDAPGVTATDEARPERLYPGELLAAREQSRASGQMVTAYSIELHRRIALPVAAALLTLVGIPLGIQPSRAVRARGLSISVAVILLYYAMFTAAVAVARRETLEAAVAMWMPNLAMGAAGLYMFRRASHDLTPYPTVERLAARFRRHETAR